MENVKDQAPEPIPESRGWRLRIGKIGPTVWDYGDAFDQILPEGAMMIGVTLGAIHLDDDDMQSARDRRREAATLLRDKGADCVIAGGLPVAALEGPAAEDEFIEDLSSEVGLPVSTSARAAVDALKALDVERLALVTTMPEDRDEEAITYFEGHGFDVVAIGGLSSLRTQDIRGLPKSAVHHYVTHMAESVDADFDGVYVNCIPFGSARHAEPIENDIGKPVVMSVQAQLWKAFQMGGIDPAIEDRGQLFRL